LSEEAEEGDEVEGKTRKKTWGETRIRQERFRERQRKKKRGRKRERERERGMWGEGKDERVIKRA